MMNALLAGIYLAAAAVPVVLAIRLFRRHASPDLRSYLLYLALWNFQHVFFTAFFLYSRYLPRTGRLGFLLFNIVILIPVEAATAIFFADFIWRRMGWRMIRTVRAILAATFLVLLAIDIRGVFSRLAADPAPENLQVSSPLSLKIMFAAVFAAAIAGLIASAAGKIAERRRGTPLVAGLTAAGMTLFIPLTDMNLNGLSDFLISGIVWTAMNIPALFALAHSLRRKSVSPATADASRSRLAEIADRFGLSEREREILGLVVRGRLNKEIAAELFISTDTVKKHLYFIFKKTAVRNRLQLFLLVQGGESARAGSASSPRRSL